MGEELARIIRCELEGRELGGQQCLIRLGERRIKAALLVGARHVDDRRGSTGQFSPAADGD